MEYKYTFNKIDINISQLHLEILESFMDLLYLTHNYPDDLKVVLSRELTTNEHTTITNIINNHLPSSKPSKNFYIRRNVSNKLITETWYETDNGDGTYSGKSEEIEFIYSKNTLTTRIERSFLSNGAVISEKIFDYYTNGDLQIIKPRG